jgi:ElaB/YqjD/DUF883 family membrane-anchored ribosome-binding protein
MDNEEMMLRMQEQIDDLREQLKSTANGTIDQAADSAKTYVGQASDFVSDKLQTAKDGAVQASHQVDDFAHLNPWQVAGAAAAVGMLVGLLVSRSRD